MHLNVVNACAQRQQNHYLKDNRIDDVPMLMLTMRAAHIFKPSATTDLFLFYLHVQMCAAKWQHNGVQYHFASNNN